MAAEPIEPEDVWAMALGSLLPGLGLLATPLCAVVAIIGFDGVQEGDTFRSWVNAVFFMSLPFASLISLVGGWTLLLGFRRLKAAQTMIAMPVLWFAMAFFLLWLAPHLGAPIW